LTPANGEDVTKKAELELHHLQEATEGGLPGDLAGNSDQGCGNSLPELQQSLGIGDTQLILRLLSQTGGATPVEGPDQRVNWNYVATALRGIGSKGELEGLLAAQMVATHNLGMDFLRRCVRQEQSNAGIDLNLNRGLKLLRMFATQLERLDHHKERGGQKMVVEHVHIYKGGQAIVGTMGAGRIKTNVPEGSNEEQD
jgi:hypothetical protein